MPEEEAVGGGNVVRLPEAGRVVSLRGQTAGGGSGGAGDGMPPDDLAERVRNLETGMFELRQELKRIADRLDDLPRGREWGEIQERLKHVATREDLAGVERRIEKLDGKVSQLPTWWQFFVGLIGMLGGLFAIIRWGIQS
jgi:hypothetical protein